MNNFWKVHLHIFFFKVQNKETKNKQPLTTKRHLALWPCSLSDTVQQCMEGWCQCWPPLPSHSQQLGGYVFEGTLSTLKASRLYLEGYFILAGSPTMLFFPYRVSQPRPWGEGTQLLREPPFQTDHIHMSLLQWLVVSQTQTQQQKEKAMKTQKEWVMV